MYTHILPPPANALDTVPFSGDGLDVDPSPGALKCLPFLKDPVFVFSKDHRITPLRNVFVDEALECGAVVF